MHEIIDIREYDGELIFSVKGIQNLLGDPNVSSSQILGKVISIADAAWSGQL